MLSWPIATDAHMRPSPKKKIVVEPTPKERWPLFPYISISHFSFLIPRFSNIPIDWSEVENLNSHLW